MEKRKARRNGEGRATLQSQGPPNEPYGHEIGATLIGLLLSTCLVNMGDDVSPQRLTKKGSVKRRKLRSLQIKGDQTFP